MVPGSGNRVPGTKGIKKVPDSGDSVPKVPRFRKLLCTLKVYFCTSKVYFCTSKVYCCTLKVYFCTSKVYFESILLYFESVLLQIKIFSLHSGLGFATGVGSKFGSQPNIYYTILEGCT